VAGIGLEVLKGNAFSPLNNTIYLTVTLSAIREPPSVLVKGSTSSGKSTLVKRSLLLFPPECIVERAGLSGKALAYGTSSLKNKILFINEYRCGKDAQLLLRLLQSEGRIRHESTSVRGSIRSTRTVERAGMPVVLTTTTDESVYEDDETRFLSLWVDESATQTLAILSAQACRKKVWVPRDLAVWRSAIALLHSNEYDFTDSPKWLQYVANELPATQIRVRRDWQRVLAWERCTNVGAARTT